MSAWAGLISGAHALIAMRRNEAHWLLNKEDAQTYGAALANAARHLPVQATQKAVDFAALVFCAANIETPRIYASMAMAKAKREARGQQPGADGATVFTFRRPSPSSPPPPTPASPQPAAQANGMGDAGFVQDGVDGPIGGH